MIISHRRTRLDDTIGENPPVESEEMSRLSAATVLMANLQSSLSKIRVKKFGD
jgi:hypothetical protein